MAALQLFKIRINNACKLVKSHESQINEIDVPFTFPAIKEQCELYIKEKTGVITNLLNSLHNAMKLQETQTSAAMEYINTRNDEKEREKLMTELSKHLELESFDLEVVVVEWQTSRIQFRQHELREQMTLLHTPAPSIPSQSASEIGQGSVTERSERQIKVRKPLLEIPTFSGNFREFNSFWTVFESLIHCDEDLSDGDKFLFLKRALKGKAAAALNCIPVVADKYKTAVDILKKHFDRSANIAHILINEIERLQEAKDHHKSCRETFEAINSRIIHLEQTGMKMNADRIWRRLILSKFPENFCATVIQKETTRGDQFSVQEILDAIDSIISLRETTSLTTETLFPSNSRSSTHHNARVEKPKWDKGRQFPEKSRKLCLCGQPHSPYSCQKYTTPEARRLEARNQRVCWRCFAKTHNSKDCTAVGSCPKCKDSHHGSLCLSDARKQDNGYLQLSQRPTNSDTQPSQAFRPQRNQVNRNRQQASNMQAAQNSQNGQEITTLDKSPSVYNQCVLQIASAMIFNEAEWDYQPITMLLDSGAQRSFIKSGLSEKLKLPVIQTTSFTTSGMGELQEIFNSNEVRIILRGMKGPKTPKKMSVHTKQKLTTPLETAFLTDADRQFISKAKITIAQQTLAKTTVSPDILIGQDFLSSIIDHTTPVLKLPSGLLLTPTIFGYAISGNSHIEVRTNFIGTFGCTSTMQKASKSASHPQQHAKWLSKKKAGTNFNESSTRAINRRIFRTHAQVTSQKTTKLLPKRKSRTAAFNREAKADRQRWLAKVRCTLGSSSSSSNTRSANRTLATILQPMAQAKMKTMDMPKIKHHAHLITRTPAVKETITANADDSKCTGTISTRKKRRGRGMTLHYRTVGVDRTPLCS